MLSNFHTHTVFCDGKNTPEDIVLCATQKGFDAIGFSGHGYTDFDESYCIKDITGYINTITGLKEKYKNKIQVYLGAEEDCLCPVNRNNFDYIIGSSHYFNIDGKYYPVDLDFEATKKCIDLMGGDAVRLADNYYSTFVDYILKRKPDIVGHFDLITKFDESTESIFLNNADYNSLAEKYLCEAMKSDCIFEVNTGAISRGYRTYPYPSENLLYLLKKNNGKVMITSDSHSIDTLDFYFDETKKILKDIGFEYSYTIYNNKFVKDYL